MNKERTALEFLDRHPKVDVTIEIVCTMLFAFLPIILVAFFQTTADEKLTLSIVERVYAQLARGELVLLTIATAGSIFWLLISRLSGFNVVVTAFLAMYIVLIALPASFVMLMRRDEYTTVHFMPNWLFVFSLILYISCLGIYIWALYCERTLSLGTRSPDQKTAEAILTDARKRRHN